jgi:hypothetical protein
MMKVVCGRNVVLGVGKRRYPFPVCVDGVPADGIDVKVGVGDDVDILRVTGIKESRFCALGHFRVGFRTLWGKIAASVSRGAIPRTWRASRAMSKLSRRNFLGTAATVAGTAAIGTALPGVRACLRWSGVSA